MRNFKHSWESKLIILSEINYPYILYTYHYFIWVYTVYKCTSIPLKGDIYEDNVIALFVLAESYKKPWYLSLGKWIIRICDKYMQWNTVQQ